MTRAHIDAGESLITKPLLAARSDGEDLSTLTYPLGLTNKIDGIRALRINGRLVSRTYKPIPNDHIRTLLEKYLPEGMDMELTSGATFQEGTGNIMRKDGQPVFKVWVIDYVPEGLEDPYEHRIDLAARWLKEAGRLPFEVEVLTPEVAKCWDEVAELEAAALDAGHEGIMLRKLDAPYKCGRSTYRECILVKVKRFSSLEGEVIGVEELKHNENAAEKDAFGRTKRSTAQQGKVAGGTLGALTVVGCSGSDYAGIEFSVGTGFTAAQRTSLWKDRTKLVGRFITVKFFPTGSDTKPRFPTFHGFRHPDDM
jgi:DNA ligase-1